MSTPGTLGAKRRAPASRTMHIGNDHVPESLRQSIEHAAHLLPAQGPITVFIHHNTLHAFEELSFTDALKAAAKVFGCQPYLAEERYRAELNRGRIFMYSVKGLSPCQTSQ